MAFSKNGENLLRAYTVEKKSPSYIQDNVNPRNHWNIISELGDGAFGKVEKAVSSTDPRLYAASKSIEIQEGEELEDFLVEIEILSECKGHPVMLGLYSTYFFDNKLTMLLEFCGGGAVDNILVKLRHSLKEDQIRYIGYHVCDALKWLHSQNVIHRDLKAGNILLTNDGQVRLAGFGVSAKLESEREKSGTIIGTPHWMAPEVMASETFKDQPYDCISDIWSFGITLLEMAKGEPPHLGVSAVKFIIKVQKADPPLLRQPSNWTRSFSDLLSICLIKDPRNRPSAAQIFSHPWLNNASSERKMIFDLLAEINVNVQEEIVVDAAEDPVARSDDISQRPGGDSWSFVSDSPRPATSDGFTVPMLPETVETPPPDMPHMKRAAASPPQEAMVHQETPVLDGRSDQSRYAEFSFSNRNTSFEGTAEFSTPSSNESSAHLSTRIDRVQMTSTTFHVLGGRDDQVQRKQQLHDLRCLQRDEQEASEAQEVTRRNSEAEAAKTTEEAKKAQEEAEKAQEEAEKAQEEAEKAQEEAEKAQEEAEKVQEEAEKAQEETKKTREAMLEKKRLRAKERKRILKEKGPTSNHLMNTRQRFLSANRSELEEEVSLLQNPRQVSTINADLDCEDTLITGNTEAPTGTTYQKVGDGDVYVITNKKSLIDTSRKALKSVGLDAGWSLIFEFIQQIDDGSVEGEKILETALRFVSSVNNECKCISVNFNWHNMSTETATKSISVAVINIQFKIPVVVRLRADRMRGAVDVAKRLPIEIRLFGVVQKAAEAISELITTIDE